MLKGHAVVGFRAAFDRALQIAHVSGAMHIATGVPDDDALGEEEGVAMTNHLFRRRISDIG